MCIIFLFVLYDFSSISNIFYIYIVCWWYQYKYSLQEKFLTAITSLVDNEMIKVDNNIGFCNKIMMMTTMFVMDWNVF